MICPNCETAFEHLCATLLGSSVYWCPTCGTIGGPDVKRIRTPLRVHLQKSREARRPDDDCFPIPYPEKP